MMKNSQVPWLLPVRPYHIWTAIAATAVLDLYEALVTWPGLKAMAGGLRAFDVRIHGYSHAQAMRLLDALGEQGRAFYAVWHLPADYVLAAVECVALVLAGLWLTREGVGGFPAAVRRVARHALVVLPVATCVLDFTENTGIALMLGSWPHLSPEVVRFASLATTMKWPASLMSLTAIAVALIAWAVRRR